MFKYLRNRETGAMNIGGIMMLGIAMVFIAIGFIFLPISTSATADILAWTYSGYSAVTLTDASFIGYSAVVGITPLLILVGFLAAAVVSGMMGVKAIKGGEGGSTNPGSLMLLGLSIIFIAIGLIIEPVLLDGVSTSYVNVESVQTETDAANTAVGVASANITLTYDPWNNLTSKVTNISSNVSGDAPVASAYTTGINRLLITGLSENKTRTVTTTYSNAALVDGTSDFTGYAPLLLVSPMLVHIGFLSAAVLSGFFGLKKLGGSQD